MQIHFFLRFSTTYGQTLFISGNCNVLGNTDEAIAFEMQYFNDEYWHGLIHFDNESELFPLQYKYILQNESGDREVEFGNDRIIEFEKTRAQKVEILDLWNSCAAYENIFYSSAFHKLWPTNKNQKAIQIKKAKPYTHEFKVKAVLLKENEVLCLGGSSKNLKKWDISKVILMTQQGNWWTAKLNLEQEQFPVNYKYGIFNAEDKKFVSFEEGNNRVINTQPINKTITILHDGFANLQNISWKGAGIAIPVFSLRTKKGWGTGEFTDLKLFADWAAMVGLKMIQILPINDTTNAYSDTDSYPYSAISAFALHPLYLNIETIAGEEDAEVILNYVKIKKQFNISSVLNYKELMEVKRGAIQKLYNVQKNDFKDEIAYFTFFDLNRHWLVPYAAFSYLRDKYNTADFTKWETHSLYKENDIQELVSPDQKHYDEIAIHYFTQYHLHQQLKLSSVYVNSKGIILKGDIPIGVCRNSVDAWMDPSLFYMDEQAGAPPDDFTNKGQNWGFPTYNWAKMEKGNFRWWRSRFEQMSNYFDAFRIDHILGFFRIWSIPINQVEGVMGRFVPALPIEINELFGKRIKYERNRFTKPFINEKILLETFGTNWKEIKRYFFDENKLKEKFDSQKKIVSWFAQQSKFDKITMQGLFDIISNVILFEEENSQGQKFHFRIGMEKTSSFQNLDIHSQKELKELYINYYFHRQDELWRAEALKKLPALKSCTEMMVCGEDLGMVPHCVHDVMKQLGILSLEIQRMPKKTGIEFFHPNDAPYLSVVSPSTHDMSTIRGWWEEDKDITNRYYHSILGKKGEAPQFCEAEINKAIVQQHLQSPAMWSIFQLQDLLGMSEKLRRKNPKEERINDPSNSNHIWNYRMHLNLEDLIKKTKFSEELNGYIKVSGR